MPTLFTNVDTNEEKIFSFNRSITDEDVEVLCTRQLDQSSNLNISLEAYSKITDKGIITLIQNCSGIKKINLKSCAAVTDCSITELAQKCPELEEINLSWCNISSRSVVALAHHCQKLKKINLRSCYVTDDAIITLVKRCKDIRVICLPWCKSLTDKAVLAIADNIPNIFMLDLKGNEKITNSSILYLAKACHCLEVVHLKRSPYATTDESITILSTNNPKLQKVNLRGCFKVVPGIGENISSKGIIALSQNCPKLSLIDLAWQNNLSDTAIISIAESCPKIESIDISGCCAITDVGIMELAKKSQFLKHLILFENKLITERSLDVLKKRSCTITQY